LSYSNILWVPSRTNISVVIIGDITGGAAGDDDITGDDGTTSGNSVRVLRRFLDVITVNSVCAAGGTGGCRVLRFVAIVAFPSLPHISYITY